MGKVSNKYALWAMLCGFAAGNGYAAGFQLFEQGVSGLGTAYASGAAAEDASTIFWNPAGMTYLPGKSLSAGLHLINASAKFKNNGSTFLAAPLPIPGGNGGDAGGLAPIPNFFYSHALNDRMRIGVGMSSVFGLKTEYEDDWVGRYQAILSDLRTININPSFAIKTDDRFSFGFGLNLVRADVKLSNDVAVNLVTRAALPPNGLPDVRANLEGDDWGYGVNIGGMFQASPSTRLGLSYRSKVRIKIEGNARFSPAIPVTPSPTLEQLRLALSNGGVSSTVDLPGMMSLNAHHQLNDRWALMGDVTWTNWSKFRELRIQYDDGRPDSVTPERWHDSLKVSLGASFKQSEKLTLRAGVARDNSPVDDEFRTPRIPDGDRTWLAFGARYNLTGHSSIDVGYAHLFVKDPKLDKVSDEGSAALRTRLIGEYDSNVNILSVQYNHTF